MPFVFLAQIIQLYATIICKKPVWTETSFCRAKPNDTRLVCENFPQNVF